LKGKSPATSFAGEVMEMKEKKRTVKSQKSTSLILFNQRGSEWGSRSPGWKKASV